MKEIKSKNELLPFNMARQKAFNSLCITLEKLYDKQSISEKDFKNEWYSNLTKENNIIADGWYNPPPNGMAILFGNRVSFDSLRNEKNWASDTIINWKEDLLYAYCSPVDKVSGIIGDISITLYFGKDKEIIKHIKNCYNAILKVFDLLDKVKDSRELFIASEKIFTNHKLKNCIVSKTDNTPLDLGHTFPKLENLQAKESLTEIEKQKISKARLGNYITKLSKEDISNIDNSLYVSLGLMKNIKRYEEKIENLNKYIEKLKES